MGFWHTGYFEFHELDEPVLPKPPAKPSHICLVCGAAFFSHRDLDVHEYSGHIRQQPTLILNGREVGRGRLYVTKPTSVHDWVFSNSDSVIVNGERSRPEAAAEILASKSKGFAEVIAQNGDIQQTYQFDFAFADAADLQGVDDALEAVIRGSTLSLGVIDTFIMESKRYPSASRYLDGIANYLYGVLAREGGSSERYQSRYDTAVTILGEFDRPPAEAICGLVAFHYNHFEHAMSKTKSARVSDVSRRFTSLLRGRRPSVRGLEQVHHTVLDAALSDSTMERVLRLCAIPLDGSALSEVEDATSAIGGHRPYDQLKLRIIIAEHHLASGNLTAARAQTAELRHYRITENWYASMRARLGDSP